MKPSAQFKKIRSRYRTIAWEDLYNSIDDSLITDTLDYTNSPLSQILNKVDYKTTAKQSHFKNTPHAVSILNIGEEALLLRIHLIRQAKKTINIQAYILRNDLVSCYLIKELQKASERGVKVRIIADAMDSANDPKFIAWIDTCHKNMSIKMYNPGPKKLNKNFIDTLGQLAFRFNDFNRRMHNKLFLVDDRFAIVGGRNIENDYFDFSQDQNFKDRDMLILGPVVHAMKRSFSNYWSFKLTIPAGELEDVKDAIEKEDCSNYIKNCDYPKYYHLFDWVNKKENNYASMKHVIVDSSFMINDIEYIADEPYKNQKEGLRGGGKVSRRLTGLLIDAQKSIYLQTPYLVLNRKARKAFYKARRNNPKLEICVSINSLAATDSVHVYSYTTKEKWKYLRNYHFRIFEFKPQPADKDLMMPNSKRFKDDDFPKKEFNMIRALVDGLTWDPPKRSMRIHAKSYVMDDEIAYIGSFNLDPRSANLNTENGVIIRDKAFAAELKKNIQRDMSPQNSWTVGLKRNRSFFSRYVFYLGKVFGRLAFFNHERMQFTSLFELKPDKQVVPFYYKDFKENYQDVGPFPEVGFSTRQIQMELIKSFVGFTEPII